MKNIVRNLVLAALAVAAIVWIGLRLAHNKKEINAAAEFHENYGNVPVKVATVQKQILSGEYSYVGTLEPMHEVNISAEAQGKIVKVNVEEGSRVAQGQSLAKIDDAMLQIQLQAQQTTLETQQLAVQTAKLAEAKAKQDLTRYENLATSGSVSDVNLQNARLGAEQATLQVKQAELAMKSTQSQIATTEEQLRKTSLAAPISGTVTARNFDLGTVVAPGSPLGTVTDISALKLAVQIPEADIFKFKDGQIQNVLIDVFQGVTFKGKVSLVGIKSDAAHSYTVEVLLSNNDAQHPLKAGLYGRLEGSASTNAGVADQPSIVIPRTALVGSVKQPQVFVVQNGKAVARDIKVGKAVGDLLEVLSGVNEGEQVVTTGQINLENGITVTVE